jgi:hypothetical protein
MFKRAYVRGIQNALVQSGHAVFPNEAAASKVADYIADHVEFDPTSTKVAREVTVKIAEHVIEASKQFQSQDGFKAASFEKVASVDDLSKLAHAHALDLMQKAAEGSTIEGGDKGNTEPSSAEAKMDLKARPHGFAEDSRGKTDVDTRPGAVGKEEDQPNKPTESPAGSNSVTEQSRTASLADLIRKTASGATGSTIMGGDKGNKEPSSAEAKMDLKQRPHGYAGLPGQGDLGQLMSQVRGPAVIGRETPHPNAPAEHPAGHNSVLETAAKAAAEDPYIALFKKTAAQMVPHLPGALSEEQKIAHVRACMGMTDQEKAHYLVGLEKEAADRSTPATPPGAANYGTEHNPEKTHSRPGAYDGRTANQGTKQAESGSLPPFMMDKKDEKKDEKSEAKAEDKKDEKKDEKEASLADHFRRISSAVQTPANA